MTKQLKLFTNGEIKTKEGRVFTRLVGGFGENKALITTKQISELLQYELRTVNQTIERNYSSFEENTHIVDLKKIITESDHLLNLGYSKIAVGRNNSKFYGLSEAGFLLYLKFADGDRAIELYKDFIEDYFKIKAENMVMEKTLQDTLKTIQEEKIYVLGSMFVEQDSIKKMELFNRSQELEKREKEIEITLAKEEIAKQFSEVVKIAEQFTNSKGLYDVGDFSKILDIKGLGRNKLFSWMRERKMLMDDNIPYQSHSEHFKVVSVTAKNGFRSEKTVLKPKGITYIIKKLIEDGKIEDSNYNNLLVRANSLKKIEI